MELITRGLSLPGELFKVSRHSAFLISPVSPPPADPMPWVWYAPTLLPVFPDELEEWMFRRFLEQGIAVAGIDAGESYGSPDGRAVFGTLYTEMVSARGYAGRPCLLARSRGGLMLYNWAAENPSQVGGIAGIYPVCDLRSYPGLAHASPAYGMSEEQLAAELTQHNPTDRLAPLARAGVPVFHIHGDSDKGVPLGPNSGEVARRYHRAGGEMTLVVAEGQGHSGWEGYFQCEELVDFVLRHAGP